LTLTAMIIGAITLLGCGAPTPATPPTVADVPTAPDTNNPSEEALIKQSVTDYYSRKPLLGKSVKLSDTTVADDYAIVDGSVGDAIVQFLVRRQLDKWQVMGMALGEPFGEHKGLLDQKVPLSTVQKLINIQNSRELTAIVKRKQSCVTVVDDPDPPTNVRSRPTVQSNIVSKLDRLQQLEVVNNRDGWLEISLEINSPPTRGWVSLNLTRVSCGNQFQQTTGYLKQLRQRGMQNDRAAIDLLIRYRYRGSDEAGGELASAFLSELLVQRSTAIDVLNMQSEEVRRKVLQLLLQVGFSPNDRQIFASKLAQQPNSPTTKTWTALQR